MDTQTLMASLASAASYEVMQADLSSVTERITVDMVTRKITTDNSKFGNDHDHLAKTKVLDITRYVGDMDLATQTAVLHWENGTNGGVYALTEVDLSEDGRMLYKWPLSEEFTQNVGAITFAVHLYTIKTGVLLYHISSDPYVGKIGKTFSATSHALETTPPSQIEECIQQMKDISAEIDTQEVDLEQIKKDVSQLSSEIDAHVASFLESTFIPITQEEYDALVETGTVDSSKYYMIVEDNE